MNGMDASLMENSSSLKNKRKKSTLICVQCQPAIPMRKHLYLKGITIHQRNDCPPDILYMINENTFNK